MRNTNLRPSPLDRREHSELAVRTLAPQARVAAMVGAMAEPRVAVAIALLAYFLRVLLSPLGMGHSGNAYFNVLADAFLHGQLALRLPPQDTVDLVFFQDRIYLYWYPFPALLLLPLVAIFGAGVSDILFTAVIGALTSGLVATLLALLDTLGIAPLNRLRRGTLVSTVAFGSVVPILSTRGNVWTTAQIVGWAAVLCGTVAALKHADARGYFLAGLALACAAATRIGLLFAGVWLAYYLLRRDWHHPLMWRLRAVSAGLAPLITGLTMLGWYNWARFGHPLETGLAWHNMSEMFRADYARYGVFNLHYLPINFYHHFLAPPITVSQKGSGWGFFWMTPVFLGALTAIWRGRHEALVWAIILSCALIYAPIGLVMGTGYLFGPRYLLDLLVPLLVLVARGIQFWHKSLLQIAWLVGIATFTLGSGLLLWFDSLP